MVEAKTFSKEFTDEVEHLFKLGAHLGHKKNRLHPRARKYVYKIINGTSIIDLTLSVAMLVESKRILQDMARTGKIPLLVATKKVISQFAAEYATEKDIPFITSKWLPGLLTNFETIMKNVKKLQSMKDQSTSGEWDKFVKHERMKLEKEMFKLEKLYGGILKLHKKPDLLIVVDIRKEHNSIVESRMYNIPVVAVADTNANIDLVSHPIVMNDDSPEVVHYVLKELIDSFVKGREQMGKEEVKTDVKAEIKKEPKQEVKPTPKTKAEPKTEKKTKKAAKK